jgi:hypothetical protein
MLHLELGVPFGPGVAGRGAEGANRQLVATANAQLTVVPAGIPDRHPTDIVAAHVPPLLDDLTKDGRTVVVDCPPLAGVAETVLLATMVDVVVVVVDTRRFNPDRLAQALARLDAAGATVAGVVLNRIHLSRKRRRSYHGYYYQVGTSPRRTSTSNPAPPPGSVPVSAGAVGPGLPGAPNPGPGGSGHGRGEAPSASRTASPRRWRAPANQRSTPRPPAG